MARHAEDAQVHGPAQPRHKAHSDGVIGEDHGKPEHGNRFAYPYAQRSRFQPEKKWVHRRNTLFAIVGRWFILRLAGRVSNNLKDTCPRTLMYWRPIREADLSYCLEMQP